MLLILAVVTINAVKGDGIIQYANDAAYKYNQAATNEQAKLDSLVGQMDEFSPKVVHSGTIPKDAIYYVGVTSTATGDYTGATSVLKTGDAFPTLTAGDVYVYGDYEYRYKREYLYDFWGTNAKYNWTPRVIDDSKQSYGKILEEINEAPVDHLACTFYDCKSLVKVPIIPNTVESLYYTFTGCSALITAPSIPSSVTDMSSTFNGCTALTTASSIPSSVTQMSNTFCGCSSLKGNIEINANPTNLHGCFIGTVEDITITGSCSAETKAALAATVETGKDNVKY